MGNNTVITTRRKHEMLQEAMGKANVLCIGVTNYISSSGFQALERCNEDASQVELAFREVRQLNANLNYVKAFTSKNSKFPPTRGHILHELSALSSSANSEDRIIFYFSGHGHRIDGDPEYYLVPQDAYSANDPTALVAFSKVLEILNASEARQKIVILDSCLSGPVLSGKKLYSASISDKFLADSMKETGGTVVISSSASDQASYEKSKHPSLSLFTSHLVRALRGDSGALNGFFLTVGSLLDFLSTEVRRESKSLHIAQSPGISKDVVGGEVILGDFRQTIYPKGGLNFREHPISQIVLQKWRQEYTKNILTEWKDRRLTVKQLEYAANSALEGFLKPRFSELRSKIRKEFNFSVSEVTQEGGALVFPNGSMSFEFQAKSKDSGEFAIELFLDLVWFENIDRLRKLLEILSFKDPDQIKFSLKRKISPLEQIPGFQAKGFEINSEDDSEVQVSLGDVDVWVEEDSITFKGIDIISAVAPVPSGDSISNTAIMAALTITK
jgi:hypothetical protein